MNSSNKEIKERYRYEIRAPNRYINASIVTNMYSIN